jgi:UDP-N-acetylmuramate: L-alanyl-gamma-D-glutamyl-meso-diaminopimelate ligase
VHVHILGIAGTFMGGIAAIAKQAGFRVTGSDLNVYPPMSTQLEALGIEFVQGYGADQLDLAPDIVVVGNALSRGMPVIEALLDRGLPYTSGRCGWPTTCSRVGMYWRSRARTVRPPPAACSRGSWSMPA